MRHSIVVLHEPALSTAGTYYFAVGQLGNDALTEGTVFLPIPGNCKIRKLAAHTPTTVGAGNSYTFTMRKRAGGTGAWSSTSLTLTHGNVATSDSGSTEVSCSAGDWICFQSVPSSAFTARTVILSVEIEPDDPDLQFFFGSQTSNATATRYLGPNLTTGASTTESDVSCLVPIAGTMRSLYVGLSAAPNGASKSRTLALRKNESTDTSLSVTVSDTATSGSTTTDVALAADDLFSMKATSSGAPTAANWGWGMAWKPDVGRKCFYTLNGNVANSGDRYTSFMTTRAGSLESGVAALHCEDGTVMELRAKPVTTITTGSYTITARKTSAATGSPGTLSVTLNSTSGGAVVGDSTNLVDVNTSDRYGWRCAPTSTPTTTRMRIACVFTPDAALSGTGSTGGTNSAGTATFSSGAATYTGSGTPNTGGASAAGNATRTTPTFTGSGTPQTGGAASSGSATSTPPTFAATGAPSTGGTSSAGAASSTAPTFTASGSASTGGAAAAGTALYASAVYSASGAASTGGAAAAGTGTTTAPSYTGSGAPSTGGATAAGAAAFVPVTRTASGAPAVGGAAAAGAATRTTPTFTAAGSCVTAGAAATALSYDPTVVHVNSSVGALGGAFVRVRRATEVGATGDSRAVLRR